MAAARRGGESRRLPRGQAFTSHTLEARWGTRRNVACPFRSSSPLTFDRGRNRSYLSDVEGSPSPPSIPIRLHITEASS